jgi:hypothetical protein
MSGFDLTGDVKTYTKAQYNVLEEAIYLINTREVEWCAFFAVVVYPYLVFEVD